MESIDPAASGRPIISNITPSRAPAAGGLPITITGSGFSRAPEARFGHFGSPALTVTSDQEIRLITPPAYPGTVQVTVSTPAGTSEPGLFTFSLGKGRTLIFSIELAYAVTLLATGFLYFASGNSILKTDFGPVPVGVPWFAAIGAVMAGLKGVVDHGAAWDDQY